MCLNPRRIVNPKRKFSQVGGHPLYMYVPCGKCAECQQSKVNEYLLRSYYESLDTFNNDGFILFDTLTYDNANVPYLSDFFDIDKKLDFMCFSYLDFRLFMVRLRDRLRKEGYPVANNLKVFCSSEYGTSPGHSHRPHYHPVFFVRFSIDPFYFSRLISECWHKGRTDGIPFQSRLYVLQKRLFSKQFNSDVVHMQMVMQYVTKYLCKDSAFQRVIDSRLDRYFIDNYGENWRENVDAVDFRRQLSRYTTQFHRQSQGFGASALKYNDVKEVIKTGILTMPDVHKVVRKVPIPSYYERKLFYTITKDFRGKRQWTLTPEGVQMKLNKMYDSIQRLSWKMQDWYDNLHRYCPDNFSFIRSKASEVLNNRKWSDFATYILCYKGRLKPCNTDSRVSLPPLDYMITLQYDDGLPAYLYFNKREPIPFPAVSHVWYGDKESPLPIPKKPFLDKLTYYSNKNVIDDSSYIQFVDFDDLFRLFCSSLYNYHCARQSGFDLSQHLKDVLKCLQTNNQPFCLTS